MSFEVKKVGGNEDVSLLSDLLFSLLTSLGKRNSSLTLEEEAQRERSATPERGKCEKSHDALLCPLEPVTPEKEDLQTVDGILCCLICPHTETGWAPKTEAGTRIVPVHPKLIEAGVLAFKNTTDSPYLIPGLETSKQGTQGAALGRAALLLKTRIGLPAEITFHSFRHTVSTWIRNTDTSIREVWIDWLLKHEASHKSQSTTTYLIGISTANLQQTVEAISYPATAFADQMI
jgi:hypothetical protein